MTGAVITIGICMSVVAAIVAIVDNPKRIGWVVSGIGILLLITPAQAGFTATAIIHNSASAWFGIALVFIGLLIRFGK
jgi:hypothetical protein